jgi:esterase/lipase
MKKILLLHGALGSADDFTPLFQSLTNLGLAPIAFSFSGHSKTPFKTDFDIEIFTEELSSYITENKLVNVPVFGYSMGGYVALNLAANQKNQLGKIITLGTKFNWDKESIEKETRMLNPEKIAEKVPAFAQSLETKHGSNWKDLVIKTANLMRDIGEKKYLNTERLKHIEIPILLGIADRDNMVTYDETSLIFKELPTSSMFVLPNSKHSIETIDIPLLSQIILNFVLK